MSTPLLSRRELVARAAVATALPAAFASGCGGNEPDVLTRIRREGYVRLGIADEPPFGYAEAGGRVTGYAVEVARLAFAALGVPKLLGVVTDFELLLDAVQAGSFDVVAAGLFVRPERCRRAAFGVPIFRAPEAFAVRSGNPLGLRDYGDVARQEEAQLGVLAGAAEAADARASGVPDERILALPSRQALREALEGGTVDAVALTTVSVRRLVATARAPERLAMTAPFRPVVDGRRRTDAGALAFRRGDDRLRRRVDREIRRLQRADTLVEIGRRFGLTAGEVRGARRLRTADLCRAG